MITNKPKAIFAWSGGKDSSYCLNEVFEKNEYEVVYLLTTLNAEFKRVSMHGVSEQLLDLQAESIGIPQLKVWLYEASYESYEKQMEEMLLKAKSEGIEHVIFGDIFLEDLKIYRENNLARIGMKAVFPLWKIDTTELIQSFLNKGFKTVTCCVNDFFFDASWVGREIDTDSIEFCAHFEAILLEIWQLSKKYFLHQLQKLSDFDSSNKDSISIFKKNKKMLLSNELSLYLCTHK